MRRDREDKRDRKKKSDGVGCQELKKKKKENVVKEKYQERVRDRKRRNDKRKK